MDEREKIQVKLRLAASLRKIISDNKNKIQQQVESGNTALSHLVDGIRPLEAASGLSYTIIQGVFSAKRDPQFTSLLGILEEGLGLTLLDFAKIYDAITEEDIKDTRKAITESRKTGKTPPPLSPIRKKRPRKGQ